MWFYKNGPNHGKRHAEPWYGNAAVDPEVGEVVRATVRGKE